MAIQATDEQDTLEQEPATNDWSLEPVEEDYGLAEAEPASQQVTAQPEATAEPDQGWTLEPVEEDYGFGVTQQEAIPVTGEEGFLRQAADVPLKIGESINTSLRALTDLFGADNAVSQNLTQNAEWYRSLLSAQALEDEQEIGRILQEAENEGVLDQLSAGLEAFSVAPVDFVASGIGSLATFAATGVAGRAAAVAGAARAGLTGARAAQFVQRGVQATQLATGAGMGAGIVKGEIYQSVKDEMMAQGKTEEEAKNIAMDAQSYMGKNLDQILIGAGLGTLDAFTGAEKIIGKVLTKGGLKPDASRIGNIIKNGITEAAPEFIQAAQEKFASNLALQREGVDVSLTQGVFSQGALEGLVGLGLGVGAGAIEPRIQTEPTKEEVSAAAAETQDVARRSMDVAPATASLVEGEAEQIVQSQAETPDERVARLQREAQEAAGEIELEEDVSGLPPVEPTPLVTPTPEAAVAPVEPPEIVEVEPAPTEIPPPTEAIPPQPPTVAGFTTAQGSTYEVTPEGKTVRTKVSEGAGQGQTFEPHSVLFVQPEASQSILADMQSTAGNTATRIGYIQEDRFVPVSDSAQIPPDATPTIATVDRRNDQVLNTYTAEREPQVGLSPVEKLYKPDGTSSTHIGNQITEIRPTPEAATAAAEQRTGAFNEFIREELQRQVDEQRGQQVLDAMEQAGESPRAVVEDFYRNIYDNLTPDVRARFDKYVERLGWSVPATMDSSPKSIGMEGAVDLGNDVQALEGIERGFVALARTANNLYARRPATEVTPTPELVAPTPTLEPPALAPLRRVVRAEQTEEDVAGLVDGGLVELYKGQPVITQAGLETLPEAERPRLTPEARKIQIDTRTSEAAAEAISKNLRIGVDQVPVDVRMPAGWTLVGDVYVPPQPQDVAPAPTPEVREARREPAITPQQDRDYLDAVERGDLDAAQAIVDQVAKDSGYQVLPLFHGTEADTIKKFRKKLSGIWLAFKKEAASPSSGERPTTIINAYADLGDNPITLTDEQAKEWQRSGSPLKWMRDFRLENRATAVIIGDYATVVFQPSQVKSADPVTRDDQGNIIPPSQRFQRGEADIRYRRRIQMGRVGMETSAVEARLQELGFPTGGIIRVVNQPDADFEGRTIILDGKATGIELNASAMRDNATIDRVLNHEFAESANADGALNKLVERLTPKEKKEINDTITRLRYEERARTSEEAARAIETLAEAWKGRGFFTRAVARVEAWASKLGFKLTRRAAEYIAARNLADINSGFKTAYNQSINVTTEAGQEIRASRREPEAIPTFAEGTPEAATLKEMEASMAKVDAASEAKGGKPETYKISEIASVWMDSGLGERELQDAIVEYTNLTPANAARVAKAINRQYNLQQRIAETGAVIAEPAPEAEGAPRKTGVQRLIEQAVGVRRPIVKLEVPEKTALKDQIRLKAREARETRKARKEAAADLVQTITDYVKETGIRGPINSRQSMSLTKKALKLDVNNDKAVDRFIIYAEKVIENANYDRDVRDAKGLIKRAKTIAKAKTTAAPQATVLNAIANINPSMIDNPFEFNVLVERYLMGFLPVTSKRYSVLPDADVTAQLEVYESQVNARLDELNRAEVERFLAAQSDFAERRGMTVDEAMALLNSNDDITPEVEGMEIEKQQVINGLLNNLAQASQKTMMGYDDSANDAYQKKIISFMKRVNVENITADEKKRYIRFANNIIANGQTFGAEQFEAIALGQERAIKASKDKRLADKFGAWIGKFTQDIAGENLKKVASVTQSQVDTLKNIFGRENLGVISTVLGLSDLDIAQTEASNVKEELANDVSDFYDGQKKKYGSSATSIETKGYAGLAAYLIQVKGNETQENSIAYRRRLVEENIQELRKSERQKDQNEASLKERILGELTGTTNAEILTNLKEINPSAYEQLVWWKDVVFPKYKDFLKAHIENFRNQANSYDNPDYLAIAYLFGDTFDLNSELETSQYDDSISLRVKQAANSIKRKDHPALPKSKSGNIANIDINFGVNQYNALVDQIERAYTAPKWEAIYAFTRTPEFEGIMGGRRNAEFVKKMLGDIKSARSRHGTNDIENRIMSGFVAMARRMSSQAVMGGFSQAIVQPGDQFLKLISTTGRYDLIGKNMLEFKNGEKLMSKFPISRRGDVQAGTQFASTFAELGRRVEASVTGRKWAQFRETMKRVGELWMGPLRISDVYMARVAWMTYYESYLNKRKIYVDDWAKEADLVETDDVRKEAAAQAESLVDLYMGASDPTKMASLSRQSNNGWREFAKLKFLPLNSFALQQKSVLISDIRDLALRTGDKKAALAAIMGNLAGMASFHYLRIFIVGGMVYPLAQAMLKGIFGVDMDEPDEEKQKEELETKWRKFYARMMGNIFAGGAGQLIENVAVIDAFNYASYLFQGSVNPDSLLDDKGEVMSFGQYEKKMSPLYRYRAFDKSEYSFGLADVITEQAQRTTTETAKLLNEEDMSQYTGDEQAYAYFATVMEWLYFFRLMDTDVTRIVRDLKRQMDKDVKEREAEIRAIRNR